MKTLPSIDDLAYSVHLQMTTKHNNVEKAECLADALTSIIFDNGDNSEKVKTFRDSFLSQINMQTIKPRREDSDGEK